MQSRHLECHSWYHLRQLLRMSSNAMVNLINTLRSVDWKLTYSKVLNKLESSSLICSGVEPTSQIFVHLLPETATTRLDQALEYTVWADKFTVGWSPVWLVWIEEFQYIQLTKYFLVWSDPIQLNSRPSVGTVILPPMASVLWFGYQMELIRICN